MCRVSQHEKKRQYAEAHQDLLPEPSSMKTPEDSCPSSLHLAGLLRDSRSKDAGLKKSQDDDDIQRAKECTFMYCL